MSECVVCLGVFKDWELGGYWCCTAKFCKECAKQLETCPQCRAPRDLTNGKCQIASDSLSFWCDAEAVLGSKYCVNHLYPCRVVDCEIRNSQPGVGCNTYHINDCITCGRPCPEDYCDDHENECQTTGCSERVGYTVMCSRHATLCAWQDCKDPSERCGLCPWHSRGFFHVSLPLSNQWEPTTSFLGLYIERLPYHITALKFDRNIFIWTDEQALHKSIALASGIDPESLILKQYRCDSGQLFGYVLEVKKP